MVLTILHKIMHTLTAICNASGREFKHEEPLIVFFEIQTELANLTNLPNFQNSVKIKNPLNISKFKI